MNKRVTTVQYIASWETANSNKIECKLIDKALNYDQAIDTILLWYPKATTINIDVRGREQGYPKPSGTLTVPH